MEVLTGRFCAKRAVKASAGLAVSPTQPPRASVRGARCVQAGDDEDGSALAPVEEDVRESLDEEASRVAMDDGGGVRECLDRVDRCPDSEKELVTESHAMPLIPLEGDPDVDDGRGEELRPAHAGR